MALTHEVRTEHIQQMLREALGLAEAVNRTFNAETIETDRYVMSEAQSDHVLARIVNLAQHAAAEAEDERMRCLGWR